MQRGYAVLALIPPAAPAVSPELLRDVLESKFRPVGDVNISMSESRVDFTSKKMRFVLDIEDSASSHVLMESQEIAALYAKDRADSTVIATYDRRITLTSDDDLPLNHFNDYIFVLEALEKIDGVILFDPRDESFI
jgi:hypothetical protein